MLYNALRNEIVNRVKSPLTNMQQMLNSDLRVTCSMHVHCVSHGACMHVHCLLHAACMYVHSCIGDHATQLVQYTYEIIIIIIIIIVRCITSGK